MVKFVLFGKKSQLKKTTTEESILANRKTFLWIIEPSFSVALELTAVSTFDVMLLTPIFRYFSLVHVYAHATGTASLRYS